jgi:hypothetical protein
VINYGEKELASCQVAQERAFLYPPGKKTNLLLWFLLISCLNDPGLHPGHLKKIDSPGNLDKQRSFQVFIYGLH